MKVGLIYNLYVNGIFIDWGTEQYFQNVLRSGRGFTQDMLIALFDSHHLQDERNGDQYRVEYA